MSTRHFPVAITTLILLALPLPAAADGPYPFGPPYGPHGPHFAPRHRPPPLSVVVVDPPSPIVVVQPAPAQATSTPVATAQPYCREYQTQTVVGGQVQPSYGTACQQPDGSWKIVSQKP